MNKKIDKQKAITRLRQEAQTRVVKAEVLKFRLDSNTFERLLELSVGMQKPVGTLVREWVVEKIAHFERGHIESPEKQAITIIANSLAKHGILPKNEISRINKLFQ